MSSPSPNKQITTPSKGDYITETMERRYAEGEFGELGSNFDLVGYNEAMKQLIDQPTKTKFNPVCSLWAKDGIFQLNDPTKKVLFECNAVLKEVVIPAGVKVLVLKNSPKTSSKSPDASVVYLTEEY